MECIVVFSRSVITSAKRKRGGTAITLPPRLRFALVIGYRGAFSLRLFYTIRTPQATTFRLHRGDSFGPNVGGEKHVGVEAFVDQLVFDRLMLGRVPQVIEFPGVIF